MGKKNFDVIFSTFKWFSKRTCRLYHARLEKLFCEYAKNIIICPSVQTDPSSLRQMVTLILKYSMYNISKSLPIPCSFIHPSFESDLIGNSEERSSRDVACHMKKVSHSCAFTVLRNSSHHSVWESKRIHM